MPAHVSDRPDDTLLSRIIRVADIASDETHELTATPLECAGIARLFKIPAIGALRGRFLLQAERQGRILATLHLTAWVTRTCVVSLEEFETRIAEAVPLIFVPADHIVPFDDDPESPDEIPFDGIVIDLGVALTEQLALTLDPYPRKPDVVLPEAVQSAPENPFAAFFRDNKGDGEPDG